MGGAPIAGWLILENPNIKSQKWMVDIGKSENG
jgi:hypothetical protein